MSNLSELLDEDNSKALANKVKIRELYEQFIETYDVSSRYNYLGNTYAQVYFNGNTRLLIHNDGLALTGFGLRNHPNAELSGVAGCGDEGTIRGTLKEIVNALAKYEKIYPKQ